jgi:hypothetical protein
MTDERQEQVERETKVDGSEINAGIHTYQDFLFRSSYTFTLNQDPEKKTEISFVALPQEVKPSMDGNKSQIVHAIMRRVYVSDVHGGLDGSSYCKPDHIFSGSIVDLENHLVSSAQQDRAMMISRELQSEAQWRAREAR